MEEIRDLINKLENELHSTSNRYIIKTIKEDVTDLYRINQELFYITERYKNLLK